MIARLCSVLGRVIQSGIGVIRQLMESTMRWIFYTLVVVNVLMAVGMLVTGSRDVEPPATAPVESSAEQSVPRIRLLEEVNYVVETREVPAASVQQTPLSCVMAGPFDDEVAAEQMTARLLVHGIDAEVKRVERSIGESLWVYLDPVDDHGALSGLSVRLRARGVDNFVISEGPLNGRMALGVFSRYDLASQYREEMLRRGLQAELIAIPRTQSEYWVSMTTEGHNFLVDSIWKRLLVSDFQLQQEENFCLDVASR